MVTLQSAACLGGQALGPTTKFVFGHCIRLLHPIGSIHFRRTSVTEQSSYDGWIFQTNLVEAVEQVTL